MVNRGDIHWCDFGEPIGSEPGMRRPVVVIQADEYNASQLRTVIVAVLTSNLALAALPGNVFLPRALTGLAKDSVVNVTAIATVDRHQLEPAATGAVPSGLMDEVRLGLRQVLAL